MINNHSVGDTGRMLSQLSIVDQELLYRYEYAFLFPSGHVYHVTGSDEEASARRLADALRLLGYVIYPIAGDRHERVVLSESRISVTVLVTVLVVPSYTRQS
jgi:hypothetical protein